MEPEARSSQGEVLHFHVPRDTAMLGLVRTSCVAAGALVVEDYDRLHDLRLAVEELAVILIRHGARDARLGVRVHVEDQALRVEASIVARAGLDGTPEPSEVSAMVVSAIADRWELVRRGRALTARLWMSSRAPGAKV